MTDLPLAVTDDRITRSFLVTGISKGVQGQRVLIGGGFFLFHQAAQYPDLDGRQFVHGVAPVKFADILPERRGQETTMEIPLIALAGRSRG
jgi:hypothetical protein